MRIIHVLPGIKTESSGPVHSVSALVRIGNNLGYETKLFFASPKGMELDFISVPNERFNLILPKILSSFNLSFALIYGVIKFEPEIVHIHGTWSFVNIFPFRPFLKNTKIIMSPRGSLGSWPLSHNGTRKKVFKKLQRYVFNSSDILHATSIQEVSEIEAFCGIKVKPIVTIPNSISWSFPEQYPTNYNKEAPYFISLGRIHQKKNIEETIECYIASKVRHGLLIIGNFNNPYAESLKNKYSNFSGIIWLGEKTGKEKMNLLRGATAFIISSWNENFAMTVLESLSLGVPVITTNRLPWHEVEERGCGYVYEDSDRLIKCYLNMSEMEPKVLMSMRNNAINYAQEFMEPSISLKWKKFYDEIINDSDNYEE